MDLRTGDIILYGKTNLTKFLVLGCREIEGNVLIRIIDPKNKHSCKNKIIDLTITYILHKAPRKSLNPPPETSTIMVGAQEIDFNGELLENKTYNIGLLVCFEPEEGTLLEGYVVNEGSAWMANPGKSGDWSAVKYLLISEQGFPNKVWKVPLSRVK